MTQFYNFFAETFKPLFGFIGKAIPALTGAADVVKFIILVACLALAAFAVVAMVVGCFKIRFFRRLARVLLVIETLGMAGLILIAVNTTNTGAFPENLVAALKEGSPLVFDLIQGIFADFGVKTVPSFIIILVLFFVIWAILHLIIFFSRKIMKRKDVADADAPDALPEEELLEEAPAPAPAAAPAEAVASVPVEEPIVPADVPEQEIETVTEADAAPAVTDEEPAEEPAEEAADEAEEETEEDVDEMEDEDVEAPVPDYVKLKNPVFMPIPSSVFDSVDFTDAKRDGFTPNPGVNAATAEKLLSDEAAEDLTVVVYEKIGDRIAELPIDALNENFKANSYVNAKILRQKGLIPESATEVKITAFGKIDKPLMVQASCFAPGVAKMIILAGGRPIQVQ